MIATYLVCVDIFSFFGVGSVPTSCHFFAHKQVMYYHILDYKYMTYLLPMFKYLRSSK